MVQANVLSAQLRAVRARFPDEPLLLAGHSAGGVVARLAMVREPALKLAALITFASPHLGTGMAEAGLGISQSPIGWVAPLFGANTINRSRDLYADLMRERPGSLLFWLNRQPHPEAKYFSVVRSQRGGFSSWRDQIVDPFSQDMNNVVALRGKSLLIPSPLKHGLHPADGVLLANLLQKCCN
jgi:pimeloyl-ACP methyl ester carboxylesterase